MKLYAKPFMSQIFDYIELDLDLLVVELCPPVVQGDSKTA